MKVLLIHPLYSDVINYNAEDFSSEFPLGLAYIASSLQEKGHEVEVLDIQRHQMTKHQVQSEIKARRGKVDLIGIGALTLRYNYVRGLAECIKDEMDVPIVLGGPLPTFSKDWDLVLRHTKVDICVIGDGELTAPDLLDKLDRLDDCPGIAFRRNGDVVQTPDRQLNFRLNDLPRPAYDLFDMEHYTKNRMMGDGYVKESIRHIPSIPVITSMGCPYWCEFCAVGSRDRGIKYRLRSPENVAEDIKYLKDTYGIGGVNFQDDLLVVSRQRITELCRVLKPLNVIWDGQARAEQVDYDLLKLMKDAGCVSIGVGVETGSPKMLKAMNKQTTVDNIENAVRSAQKLDLGLKIQLIFGFPGESRETVQETVDMFKRLHHPARAFNIMTPIPGSPLYARLLSQGKLGDEKEYLEKVSLPEWGFRYGKPIINLTEFSDEEYPHVGAWAEQEMGRNYWRYLRSHPHRLVRHYYRQWRYVDKGSVGSIFRRAFRKFKRDVLRQKPQRRLKAEIREEQAKLRQEYQF